MSYLIEVEAVDTLFFRNAKPFTMGEDSAAESIFPAPLSTIYGALLSSIISESDEHIENVTKGDGSTLPKLKIKGLFFSINENDESYLYMPIPQDLVENEKCNSFLLPNFEKTSILSNSPLTISVQNKQVETVNGYMSIDYWKLEYCYPDLEKSVSLNDIIRQEKIPLQIDIKIGLGINASSNTAEESKLYRLKMLRPSEVNFDKKNTSVKKFNMVLEIEGDWQIGTRFIRLGGEGKVAKIQEYKIKDENNSDDGLIVKLPPPNEPSEYLKMYFLTPAPLLKERVEDLFEAYDKTTKICTWKGIEMELVSIFSNRYEHAGGFDLRENKAKVLRKSLVAGTVFYFKLIDYANNWNALLKAFHYTSIYDNNLKVMEEEILRDKGYGITLITKF